MLALLGFVTILALLGLIMTKRATPLVALIVVPAVAAVVSGHVASLGQYVADGIQQTAPVVATFIFAILYFGVMSDAGMLDPVVDRIVRTIGTDPTRIVVGSAVLASVVHLDGSGAVTFLVTIPALLPLYDRLGMDRRVLACVVALGAGVMNILPWGGPLLRAATALEVSVADLFVPIVPVFVAGMVWVVGVAYVLGRREALRIGPVRIAPAARPEGRVLSEVDRALRRPGRRWINVALTVAVLAVMVTNVVSPATAFIVGTALALVVNYPDVAEQRRRVDAHAMAALMMASVLLAAGVFIGVMKGTGALTAMAEAGVSIVPPQLAPHIPVVLGLLSMPLSLMFDPDSFYFGVLPVVAKVAETFGVPAEQVGQAALFGQMTTGFPVSPLTPATFLLVGLSGVDLADHQRFSIPYLFGASVTMTMVAALLGVLTL
jgi:CitMHS family citrate-Mg2+:H+ or citrate-Ca2+:H+ symporter